jgi:WD40-like Beta Propeller Repeat
MLRGVQLAEIATDRKRALGDRSVPTFSVAILILAILASGAHAQAPTTPLPQGKLAFVLPQKRGYVVTGLRGRVLRTVLAPRGRRVIGIPDFDATGNRLWFLTVLRQSRSKLKLHVFRATGRRSGRAYPIAYPGVNLESRVAVSPAEDRIAIGSTPSSTRGCGEAVILSRRGQLLRTLSAPGKVGVDISSWAPGGRTLVYAVNRWDECGKVTPAATLFLAARRGLGPDRRIAFESDGDFSASAWSPDGRRLAFSNCEGRSLKCRLLIVDARTGAQRSYGGNPYPLPMAWAAKTGEIVTGRGSPQEGLWGFNPSSRRWRALAASSDIEEASADGNRLAIYNSGETPHRGVLDVETASFRPFPRAVQRRFRGEGGAAAYFVR